MAGRADLEHAEREANSLKRFGDVNGYEDLADFAALTLALVAQLRLYQQFALQAHPPHHDVEGCRLCGLIYRAAEPDPAAGHADPEWPP